MKTFFLFLSLVVFSIPALAVTQPLSCSWDHPGVNPYKLEPAGALNDYQMDSFVREKLKSRMRKHDYEDFIEIDSTSMKSQSTTYTDLRDMHYGQGRVCRGPVTKTHWKKTDTQRALIYCEGDVCVAVPTVCNNVSLITRVKPVVEEPPLTLGVIEPLETASDLGEPIFGFYSLPLLDPQEEVFCNCFSNDFYFGYAYFPSIIVIYNSPGMITTPPVVAVPEPFSYLLLLAGIAVLLVFKKHLKLN